MGRGQLPEYRGRIFEDEEAAAEGKSVAWMHGKSMGALTRKLLCAMMTNDHFFVSAGPLSRGPEAHGWPVCVVLSKGYVRVPLAVDLTGSLPALRMLPTLPAAELRSQASFRQICGRVVLQSKKRE